MPYVSFDAKAGDLIDQFVSANKAEGAAIAALRAHLNTTGNTLATAKELRAQFVSAHETAIALRLKLREFEL